MDVTTTNQCWAMDFVSDALFNGKRFRALSMLDVCSRECLKIYADKRITGDTVVDILNHISYHRGRPERIRVDNGQEFISKVFDSWTYEITLSWSSLVLASRRIMPSLNPLMGV